jgi:hypothetical protein
MTTPPVPSLAVAGTRTRRRRGVPSPRAVEPATRTTPVVAVDVAGVRCHTNGPGQPLHLELILPSGEREAFRVPPGLARALGVQLERLTRS